MLNSLLNLLEKIPQPVFLVANAGLGGFVLLAHGGALLLVVSGRVPTSPGYAELVRTMASVTLPIAGFVVIGSAIGLVWSKARRVVLPLQAVVLFLSGLALLGWACGIVIKGIPAGNFRWTPGLLTGWVAYSAFLFGRFALPESWRRRSPVRYLAVIATAVTFPVDVGVLARFLAKMSHL